MDNKTEDEGTFEKIIREIDEPETDPLLHLSLQLDAEARAMIRACKASGKTSSITLKLVAKPAPGNRVELTHALSSKLPKPAAMSVVLYADDMGDLFNSDPDLAAGSLPGMNVKTTPRSAAKHIADTIEKGGK